MALFREDNSHLQSSPWNPYTVADVYSISSPSDDARPRHFAEKSFASRMSSPERFPKIPSIKRDAAAHLRLIAEATNTPDRTPSPLSARYATPSDTSSQIDSLEDVEMLRTKRSFFRAKRNQRQGDFDGQQVNDKKEDATGEKRVSVLRKIRSSKRLSNWSSQEFKNRISSPFGFQHLTHTSREQFVALQRASDKELTAACIASTPSPTINGYPIKDRSQQTPAQGFPTTQTARTAMHSPNAIGYISPPHSPLSRTQPQHLPQFERHLPLSPVPYPLSPIGSRSNLRQSPSFARQTEPHRQLSPPFQQSPLVTPVVEEEQNPFLTTYSRRESGSWDSINPEVEAQPAYVGHALTTLDQSAIQAMTPPFSPGLENVTEESERFVSPRPAPSPPVQTPPIPEAHQLESFTFPARPSSPTRARSRKLSSVSPKCTKQKRDSILAISRSAEKPVTKKSSNHSTLRIASDTWRAIDDAWEEDIDYVYDNALEADCDLECSATLKKHQSKERLESFSKASPHLSSRITSQYGLPMHNAPYRKSVSPVYNFSRISRQSLVVPSVGNIPGLESPSPLSVVTNETDLRTPSDLASPVYTLEAPGHSSTPYQVSQHESKHEDNVTYEQMLDDYSGSESRFRIIDMNQSATSSTRSSHFRSSKRSSYDSLMSSGRSLRPRSSPIRRSASSVTSMAGSVPDLVPSRLSHQDPALNSVIDRLAERVAAFKRLNEEIVGLDNTHLGQINTHENIIVPRRQNEVHIESGLTEHQIASEVFRQDSTNYTQDITEPELPQQHLKASSPSFERIPSYRRKQAASDSAAKLMAGTAITDDQPPKRRGRAATTTQANRAPVTFSLFPSPPKMT